MIRPLLLTCLATSSLGVLSACPAPVRAPGTVTGQNATSTSLKFRFDVGASRPSWLDQVANAEIRVYTRGGGLVVTDRFAFSASSSTASIERTLDTVPTGQIEVQVDLLNGSGQTVKPTLQTSFVLSANPDGALLVQLTDTPALVAPVSVTGTSLAALRTRRRELLTQIQTASEQEDSALRQLTGLRNSPLPEDQVLREQFQAELQSAQTRRQALEADLETLNQQLARLESQSAGGGVSISEDILDLRAQVSEVNATLNGLLNQRRLLAQEASTLAGTGSDTGRLNQIQGELQTLDGQIDARVTELERIQAELEVLESRFDSQNQGQPAADQLPRLQAQLSSVNGEIDVLNGEIASLRQRIEVLLPDTSLQQVQRREALQAELRSKEALLAQKVSLKASVEAQIAALS
ncbi:MAG: hypothetical protein ACO1RX_23135 [Candidatus Sericytochromatia bacterium]